jgi:hypothetical protein
MRFTDFKDNFPDGIYVNGINYPELIKNKFIVHKSYAHGAVLMNATGYKIEENTFENNKLYLDEKTTGLWIQNSGGAENEVYKNKYWDLYVAQQFSDKNDYRSNSTLTLRQFRAGGLQTLCNEFHHSRSEDIFVGYWNKFTIPTRESSIRECQGAWSKSSGNEFYDHPTLTIVNINNEQSPYSILYFYDKIRPVEMPNNVTSNVSVIYSDPSGGCPSKLGSVTEGGIESALTQYNDWNSEYEMWLDKLIFYDGNDEESSAMVSYYSALKDNLFNAIIVETFGGDDGKDDPETIIQNLRDLFSYRGNYTDYLAIVETYLAENDYNQALTILENMYSQFEVTPEDEMELEGLETYIDWLQRLDGKGINIYELPTQEVDYLINYVNANSGRGAVFANIILCELYEICIEEEEAPTSEGEMITRVEDPREPVSSASSAFKNLENITLYPNPTTGELTITNDELKITSIDIFDVYGRKLYSSASSMSQHTTFNISHLNSGIYFIKITTEVGEVVKKVVKQ